MAYTKPDTTRVKALMALKTADLEEHILKTYPQAVAIEINPYLDRAIILPPRDPEAHLKRYLPVLVAHTDTVFGRPLSSNELGEKNGVLYSKHKKLGIGADDRAGVTACLDLYDKLDHVVVVFCPNEETGCEGSRALTRAQISEALKTDDGEDLVDYMGFALQFDRRGARDIVTYDVGTKKFVRFLERRMRGYESAAGSFSDICELCPTLGIAGANLSIGYNHEHTKNETLDIYDYQRTVDTVADMLLHKESNDYFDCPVWNDTEEPAETNETDLSAVDLDMLDEREWRQAALEAYERDALRDEDIRKLIEEQEDDGLEDYEVVDFEPSS